MANDAVTGEEIAKAREFLREVRAVCRKHGMQLGPSECGLGLVIWNSSDPYSDMAFDTIRLDGSDIDLNEG